MPRQIRQWVQARLTSVTAGTEYVITEATVAGYTPSYKGCVITPELGKEYTCTITNSSIAPTVVLRKVVVNDNGGTLSAVDVDLSIGTTHPTLTGTATDASSAPVTLKAGVPYMLSEVAPAGYSASAWTRRWRPLGRQPDIGARRRHVHHHQ